MQNGSPIEQQVGPKAQELADGLPIPNSARPAAQQAITNRLLSGVEVDRLDLRKVVDNACHDCGGG